MAAKIFRDPLYNYISIERDTDQWSSDEPSIHNYLAVEEFTVLTQIQAWSEHPDKALSDLARRFLCRERFVAIDVPESIDPMGRNLQDWEEALRQLVRGRREYDPPDMYCLKDNLRAKYSQPYFPEKEPDEQAVSNAIRLKKDGEAEPVEISKLLPRLQPVTAKPQDRYRYYVPKDLERDALRLRSEWKPPA